MLAQCFVEKNSADAFCRQSDFIRNDESHVQGMLHERVSVIPEIARQSIGCYLPGFHYH